MNNPEKLKVTAQDAYNYIASKFFADQQLCMVLKLNGELNLNAFAEAIRLTLDLEPLLGCRLAENNGMPFWERRGDLGDVKLLSVVENNSSLKILEGFINEPIYADVDPLVKARIVKEENTDVVCIKINHSACDAGGLKEYVSMLSALYTKIVNGEKNDIQPNLGRRDQTQIFENTKNPRSIAMKGFPTPTWTFPQKTGTQRLHAYKTIPRLQFEKLKRYSHDKNSTITEMFLAAMYQTFFALNNTAEHKPMINQVSIDLRRYLPNRKTEALCNLSGALYVSLERKKDEAFEGTLARVTSYMSKLKENCPGLESAAGLEYLFSQGFVGMEKYMAQSAEIGRKCNVTFPLLSNFGVLNDYQFDKLHTVKGYITSPIMYPPGFMLGATTFNNEITLSIGYCGQENTKQIYRLLEAFENPTEGAWKISNASL